MRNKPFRLIHEAEQELEDAAIYYNQQTPGLEKEFISDIEKCINDIISFPDAWSPFFDNIRRHSTNRFPFRICYVITEKEILGIAVEHTSREPKYWIDRLK
ncbi:MAG: type II toxin-antitoxin system RelE/ParE family toxin [Victivallaceae bacterium]|nr:type II toxin-antitoxin system RelE/ParE family toxin [Victivallaceae bacterium]